MLRCARRVTRARCSDSSARAMIGRALVAAIMLRVGRVVVSGFMLPLLSSMVSFHYVSDVVEWRPVPRDRRSSASTVGFGVSRLVAEPNPRLRLGAAWRRGSAMSNAQRSYCSAATGGRAVGGAGVIGCGEVEPGRSCLAASHCARALPVRASALTRLRVRGIGALAVPAGDDDERDQSEHGEAGNPAPHAADAFLMTQHRVAQRGSLKRGSVKRGSVMASSLVQDASTSRMEETRGRRLRFRKTRPVCNAVMRNAVGSPAPPIPRPARTPGRNRPETPTS